ncbi:MAG: TetR/AcrR family transcriptional regulator [Gemmatimonadetes bacterium]|jgi:AcrR family transcriptional regulator|nr:TetR/AcrR family transcriptional regulator [Gemmatimonadota bacterium]MBP6670519.1 TetR/AcrR family transcriptional regulator [Gemmatimonadales bacterium]MBK6780569.1 TetR/AcrR family transcriptional regulator [Gemmatimonadota bacterium]MBK7351314.1 TetR/AcrR family transcriptional regulator [Gemmatimonadota bacterium]MBK7715288.1 TetR/AcrR family transcriptional regulator [Gemmatimonadota bacterium]
MNSTPGPRTGAATRARLLEAGFTLFTTTGFLRTTTPALAAHAGIAEGTIYRHFKSKDALLTECHRLTATWAIEALKGTEGERGARTPERLAAFAGELVARATEHPPTIRVLFAEDHEPFLDEPTRGLRRAFGDALVQLMAMGKSDGLVRSGPAEVWAAVWLAVIELGVSRVAAGDWTPDSGNLALTVHAAWDAIAAPDRPSAPPAE